MKKMMLLLAVLVFLSMKAQAQETQSQLPNDLIATFESGFTKLPNLKEGFFVDFKNHRGLNNLGLEVANGGYFGKFWSNFCLNANYIGQDGIGPSLGVKLSILPASSFPIISLLQDHAEIGYGVGWRTLTTDGPTSDNPKSDNRMINGLIISAKWKF